MGNQAGQLSQRLTSNLSKEKKDVEDMVMFQQALRPVKNEKGAVAIEYGLLAGLIAVAIIAGARLVGPELVEFSITSLLHLRTVILAS